MSVKKKLIRNTVANYGIQLWSSIIGFLLSLVIIYYIGIVEYGIYLLVTAFVGYFGLLDMGIGTSVIKFVAEYRAKGDTQKLNEVVNTAFFIFLFIGIIGSVGLIILGTFFIDVFKIEADQLWKARLITYLLASSFLTGFSLSTFRGVLGGLQRYHTLASITFAMSLINAAVVIWVLLMGYGIVELVFYTIVFGLLRHILIAIKVQKLLPSLRIKKSYVKRSMLRTVYSLSLMLLFISLFARIIYYTDTLVIGFFLAIEMITFYTIAWKIYEIPGRPIDMTLSAMMPATSELDAMKKERTIQLLFLRVLKYCLALICLIGIPILFMSREILRYGVEWTGGDFSNYYLVTNILIISIFFDYFNYVSIKILTAMNKLRLFVLLYGIAAIMNIILSIILVQEIGLEGVALGTTIPFIALAPVFMWYSFKTIGVRSKDYVKVVLSRTLPFAALMGVVLYLLMMLHTPNNLIEVAVYFIIGAVIFGGLFYVLGLDENEKADLKGIFGAIRYREEDAI